jgi:transposase
MLNMSQINHIRDLSKCGYRISEIHVETGTDSKTIRKYINQEDFSPNPPIRGGRPSILDPYKDTISEWLEEDTLHWKKQRHTAVRVYKRLRNEYSYQGSYDTVQKYMNRLRKSMQQKATQELIWEPGSAQVDFGEADFYEDNQCVRKKYLAVSYPFSNDSFTQVFGGETAECVCQGLKDIFEYVGCVPKILIFDNATGVGRRIYNHVIETELFAQFRAHYGFLIRFCNPHAGWEKGNVENKVGTTRRNLFVPPIHYHDIIVLNKELLDKHKEKASERHYKKGILISDLFKEDLSHFLSLPRNGFNVCRYDYFKADGYGKVCIDGKHHYSTRPEYHGHRVLVGVRAHDIEILDEDGKLLVRHRRAYGEERTDISDYSTTLEVLSRSSGAWFNSGIRKETPELLRDYLDSLEKPERKGQLRLMKDLAKQYGYKAAVNAMNLALGQGKINQSDASILAARITGYGIDTPPEVGPPLSVYDEAFLNPSHRKEGDTL